MTSSGTASSGTASSGTASSGSAHSGTAISEAARPGVANGAGLLRSATIGSVDDGKSTLIGRLLHDTKQLFDDQLEALSDASRRRGVDGVDLAFVTDGLRAEREQGITIDVAYRYAATPYAKFVIADCPGHVQYTRNMATGASTADVAVVVVDVTSGLRDQTRRHCCIAALLGVRSWVVAVNKMDLVGWDRAAFEAVADDVAGLARSVDGEVPVVVPVSALDGDNVATPSIRSPWYSGPTVLQSLEQATAGAWARGTGGGARLPVQWVLRRPGGGRDYAGMVSGGDLHPGDAVVILPSGARTTIAGLSTFDGPLTVAEPPLSVTVSLTDDVDVARGDLIVPADSAPEPTQEIEATVCWFAETPLRTGEQFLVKHTTRITRARVVGVESRLDIATMTLAPTDELTGNDIGVVRLQMATPLAVDPYRVNRVTGSFVIIDESTNATVAAAMVGQPPVADAADRV